MEVHPHASGGCGYVLAPVGEWRADRATAEDLVAVVMF